MNFQFKKYFIRLKYPTFISQIENLAVNFVVISLIRLLRARNKIERPRTFFKQTWSREATHMYTGLGGLHVRVNQYIYKARYYQPRDLSRVVSQTFKVIVLNSLLRG